MVALDIESMCDQIRLANLDCEKTKISLLEHFWSGSTTRRIKMLPPAARWRHYNVEGWKNCVTILDGLDTKENCFYLSIITAKIWSLYCLHNKENKENIIYNFFFL